MTTSLNPRQQKFVQEYLKDPHVTRAAIAAGYSEKTAASIGSRLLKNVKVSTALGIKAVKTAERADVSVARVLQEYCRIAFLNPQSFYDDQGRMLSVPEMPEDSARAIAGIDEELIRAKNPETGEWDQTGVLKKIRVASKVQALEGLARHLGMFMDMPTSGVSFQIQINIGGTDNGTEPARTS